MTDTPDGKTPREGLDEAYEDPQFKAWAKDVQENMAPKMKQSSLVASIISGADPDPKIAVEIGYCLLLDKPLVLCVLPGVKVPERLVRVADAIVEVDLDDAAASQAALSATILRLQREGVVPA